MERRPHVRLMLSRCEWKPREVDKESMKTVMTKNDLTAWHSRMIRDPAIPLRQRLSSARQLAILKGWIGGKDQQPDEHSILADIMREIDGATTGLPSERHHAKT